MICYVIGKGSIGHRHAQNLTLLKNQVIHLSWRKLDLSSFDSLLQKNQDNCCVVIATATDIRMPIIEICSKNNVPMYIEKPIAYLKDELNDIFSMPDDIQKRSFAGFMMRYHPLVRYLAEMNFEDLYNFNVKIGQNINDWRENWKFSESYAASKSGGGVLLDLCHEIDLAFLLSNSLSIKEIFSIGHKDFNGVDICSSVFLSSKLGLTCSITMDYIAPQLIRAGNISTSKKYIEYDLVKSSIKEITKDDIGEKNFNIDRNQIFIDAMKDFLNAAKNKQLDNPIAPRLDKVKDVCFHIADAYEKRKFIGNIEVNLE